MFIFIVLVSKTPDLDYIKFTWNKNTASEFEQHWKENKISKKADFIHMIQVSEVPTMSTSHHIALFSLPACWYFSFDPFSGYITGIDCCTLTFYVYVNMLQVYTCAPHNIISMVTLHFK